MDPSHPNRFTLLKNMGVSWGGCVESRPMPYDVQETAPDPATPATLFTPFFAPDEPDAGYYNYSGYKLYHYGSYSDGTAAKWANSSGNPSSLQLFSENNYLPDGVADQSQTSSTGGAWAYTSGFTASAYHQNALAKYKQAPASGTSVIWDNGTGGPGTQIGPNAGCTVQPIQRLTTNTTAVDNMINSMVAGGDTEIPLGLVWGWHALSPNLPFADGSVYGAPGVIKVIVLVTDGADTYSSSVNVNQSHYTAYAYADQQRISTGGAGGTATALNTRLQTLCSNMKTQNVDGTWKINIYTVPLEVTDSGIKSLLQGCVTDPANYLDTTSSSQLAATFQNIAGSIQALRVAH